MIIVTSIEIQSKPEEVFSWIDNPDKAILWQKGVKSGEIIRETPQKIGTTFKEEMEENGKSLVMFGEITDYFQDKLISFHFESKIHKVDVKYSIIENNNKSIVTVDSKIKWRFPMNLICIFIGKKIELKILRETENELIELKRLCEVAN